jgi:hypothetical protein
VEPSAVAARRTRASLALAVVGAIVLMAGVALVLSGEALKLEHQARPPSLLGPGLVLAFLGLALGASAGPGGARRGCRRGGAVFRPALRSGAASRRSLD